MKRRRRARSVLSGADPRRKTVSDRFGERGASSGRLPLPAVPLKPVVGVAIFWPIGWLEVAVSRYR
jgi:hypothetical protein